MATYWVSKSLGSDSNNGLSEGAPFQTIAKALATYAGFTNGDTINVMDGTYFERIIIPRLGEAGNFVTIQNAPGHSPILDGTGLGFGWMVSATNLIKNSTQDLGYVKVQGFEIRNHSGGGMLYEGEGRQVHYLNNYIHDQFATPTQARHAILINAQTYDGIYHYWTIEGVYVNDNHLLRVETSVQPPAFQGVEAITLAWNIKTFHVARNIIDDCSFIGIDILGYDAATHIPGHPSVQETGTTIFPNEGVVEDNIIINSTGEAGSTSAYYSDGGRETLWQGNFCDGMGGPGFAFNAEDIDHSVDRNLVRNNVIRDTIRNYIQGGYNGSGLTTHNRSRWCHNVSHNATNRSGSARESFTNAQGGDIASRNNISYITTTQITWHRVNSFGVTALGTQDHDYNCYWPASASPQFYFQWNNQALTTTLATFASGSGQETNGVVVNPQFINVPNDNYNLSPGSALIGAGAPLTLANGAGVASTTLVVDDSLWFSWGYGVIGGDIITIGTANPVEIVGVNDSTKTITLAEARTWSDNDPINYAALSGTVDYGLFEFATAAPPSANAPINVIPSAYNVVLNTPTLLDGVSTGDLDGDISTVVYNGGTTVTVRVGSLGPPPTGVTLDI